MARRDKGQDLPRRPDPPAQTTEPPTRVVAQQTEVSLYAGPLPDPKTLAQYNAIVPGAAEQIIGAFVKQGTHRRKLEFIVIWSDVLGRHLGWLAGLAIAFGGMYLTYRLGTEKHDWLAGTIFGTTLVSLVGTFVAGREKQAKERLRKSELMTGERQHSEPG